MTVPGEADAPERSIDAFLGGLVTLVQPRRGHRAGLDAALLQALVPAAASGYAVDLGTGVGTVAFSIAARAPALCVAAVEREPELVACVQAALRLPANAAFARRVRLVEGDLAQPRPERERLGLAEASAEWVLMNPPYDLAGRVRASQDALRRGAHVAGPGNLAAWCRTAAGLARPGGFLGLIHRTQALPEIIAAVGRAFGDIRVMPVYPSRGAPAIRVLVRARRGSRASMQIMPGLQLHDESRALTALADGVLQGRAELPF